MAVSSSTMNKFTEPSIKFQRHSTSMNNRRRNISIQEIAFSKDRSHNRDRNLNCWMCSNKRRLHRLHRWHPSLQYRRSPRQKSMRSIYLCWARSTSTKTSSQSSNQTSSWSHIMRAVPKTTRHRLSDSEATNRTRRPFLFKATMITPLSSKTVIADSESAIDNIYEYKDANS